MPYQYANLDNPRNTESGIAEFLLLAPMTAFAANGLKCPAAPFTNPGDEVTIRQPHVFLPGEGFIKLLLAPEKNELNAETVGDKGFQKLRETIQSMMAGTYPELHEAVKNWKNKPLIILAKDSNCDADLWYQVGCECEGSYMTASFATGTTVDGNKGYTLSFSRMSNYITIYAPKDGLGNPIDPLTQLKP
jgi:hypothetical protein